MNPVTWILNLVFRPAVAIYVVCVLANRPDLAPKLEAISRRETRLKPWGVHEGDTELVAGDGYYGQVRWGHLDPECQAYRPNAWATRGSFGLSAASHWNYLPKCYQPEILDITLVSAGVAVAKYQKVCETRDRPAWCRTGRNS